MVQHKHKKKSPQKDNSKRNNSLSIAVIIILAAIPFSFGKYFEFNSPDPYDSGAYVYSAKHILDGAKIGVDEKPSAQTGTLFVNILGVWMFGYNEIGPKLLQTIFQAAALVLMFITMQKLFGKLPAAIGVIIASVYLSAPFIAKFGNVKEQHMIAFMIMAMSCFVLYQFSNRWWLAVLAGALAVWAPLFKQTGTSVIGAIGLFVILQPIFKHRSWKKTFADILLLLGGAIASLAPIYIWAASVDAPAKFWPYSFVWPTLVNFLPTFGIAQDPNAVPNYITGGRKMVPFAQHWPKVLRYYTVLILPISLAIGSIIARLWRMVLKKITPAGQWTQKPYDRFVILFAVWWILDMAFVWISPRSYQQYYLPLTASAAMLAGYLIALYRDATAATVFKTKWLVIGFAGFMLMTIMSWNIFFGIEKSPDSGMNYGAKRRGYAQTLKRISARQNKSLRGSWERAGQYIRNNSTPTDKMYVWGWYPGIYVSAQRFSSASSAFMMPRQAMPLFKEKLQRLLDDFGREKPKFIVDSRKRHIPTERPPYELWPIVPKRGFLPLNKDTIDQYDTAWSDWLHKNFGEDEALRYQALKPFREFVMQNYTIVQPVNKFWPHVVFQLKNDTANN